MGTRITHVLLYAYSPKQLRRKCKTYGWNLSVPTAAEGAWNENSYGALVYRRPKSVPETQKSDREGGRWPTKKYKNERDKSTPINSARRCSAERKPRTCTASTTSAAWWRHQEFHGRRWKESCYCSGKIQCALKYNGLTTRCHVTFARDSSLWASWAHCSEAWLLAEAVVRRLHSISMTLVLWRLSREELHGWSQYLHL